MNQRFNISLVTAVLLCTNVASAGFESFRKGATAKISSQTPNDRDVSLVRLRFSGANGSSDECVLHFYADATNDYDWMHDALKMESLVSSAAECALISANNYALSIDSRPFPDESMEIEIMADMPLVSDYCLQVYEAIGLPVGFCVSLLDVISGDEIPVVAGETLFLDQVGPYSGNRFLLKMTRVVEQSTIQPLCVSDSFGEIVFECESNDWIIGLFQNGFEIQQLNQSEGAFSNLEVGPYEVVFTSLTENCAPITMSSEIFAPLPIQVEMILYEPDHCNNSSDGFALFEVNNISEYNFDLIDGTGTVVLQANSVNGNLMLDELNADIYTLEIDGVCGTLSSTFDVRDPLALEALIEPGDITLLLSPQSEGILAASTEVPDNCGIQWLFDGVLIGEDEDLNYPVSNPGNFNLELIAANASCESRDTSSVEVAMMTSVGNMNLDVPFSVSLSNQSLVITVCESDNIPVEFVLFDMQGREVWHLKVQQYAGVMVDVSFANLSEGQYVLVGSKSGQLIFSEKWMLK